MEPLGLALIAVGLLLVGSPICGWAVRDWHNLHPRTRWGLAAAFWLTLIPIVLVTLTLGFSYIARISADIPVSRPRNPNAFPAHPK